MMPSRQLWCHFRKALEDVIADIMDCLKETKAENQQLRKEFDVATRKIDSLERYSERRNLIINELLPSSDAEATAWPSQDSPFSAESSADTKTVLQHVNETHNLLITSSDISVEHRLPWKS